MHFPKLSRLKTMPLSEFRVTFSTLLTLLRILLTPFIVWAMVRGQWGVACALFTAAALTDFLDGMLARLFNQQTFLGACLDPLADKFLMLSCFTTLSVVDSLPFPIPRWFVVLVLIREFLIVSGFLFLYISNRPVIAQPTLLGKMTTMFHTLFIWWLFACYFFNWLPLKTYCVVLVVSSVLVIVSLLQYSAIGLCSYRRISV